MLTLIKKAEKNRENPRIFKKNNKMKSAASNTSKSLLTEIKEVFDNN